MNILLTDLNSLNLEVPAVTAAAPGGNENFSRLLQQQLPDDVDGLSQVADFSEFFSTLPASAQTSGEGTVDAVVATWQDYLAQQEIRVTTDAGPWPVTPIDATDGLGVETRGQLMEVSDDVQGAGEALPGGGNILPPTAAGEAPGVLPSAAHPASSVVRQFSPVTAGLAVDAEMARDTSVAARSNHLEAQLAQAAPRPLPLHAAGPPANPPAALHTPGAPGLSAAPVEAQGIPGDRPMPATLSRTTLAPNPEIGVNPQGGDTPAPAPAAAAGRLAPTPLEAEPTQMRELAASAQVAVPEIKAQAAQPARAVLAADASVSGDTGEAPAPVPTMPRTTTESMIVGTEQGARNADIPAPAGQSQSAMPAAAAAAQAPALASPITPPGGSQPALPPLLDSMSLARAAEPAEWGDGLGERVSWMINQKQNSAVIRLDPPLLGKLDVQVKIVDDATTITIQTQHAQTRELIETASVRLRDYLQESGFQNVNVDVSQRQDQQQGQAQNAAAEHTDEQAEARLEAELAERQGEHDVYAMGEGLLDTFA